MITTIELEKLKLNKIQEFETLIKEKNEDVRGTFGGEITGSTRVYISDAQRVVESVFDELIKISSDNHLF